MVAMKDGKVPGMMKKRNNKGIFEMAKVNTIWDDESELFIESTGFTYSFDMLLDRYASNFANCKDKRAYKAMILDIISNVKNFPGERLNELLEKNYMECKFDNGKILRDYVYDKWWNETTSDMRDSIRNNYVAYRPIKDKSKIAGVIPYRYIFHDIETDKPSRGLFGWLKVLLFGEPQTVVKSKPVNLTKLKAEFESFDTDD